MSKCLVGVSVVKNEADIIEASVRHNLRFLDRLIVLDHDSADATTEILRSLVAEGLSLSLVEVQANPVFKQGDWTTMLAQQAFREHAADYVFPLDADEFLRVDSRATLDAALARAHAPVMSLPWPTYVRIGGEPGHPLRELRWRVDAENTSPLRKIVLSRQVANGASWKLGEGNHVLFSEAGKDVKWDSGKDSPLPDVQLAHLPLRSPQQLLAKVLIGWLVRKLNYGPAADTTSRNWHFRELYGRIMRGGAVTYADVHDYAIAVYAFARNVDEVDLAQAALVEDQFAELMPLRYTPAEPVKPELLLAAWASALVARISQTAAASTS
jgi:hypothetical protein